MFPLSFDELNQLAGYKRSLPYDEYFEDMQISQRQKERRIGFAKDLDEEVVYLMAMLFYQRADGVPFTQEQIDTFKDGYYRVLREHAMTDDYLDRHIEFLAASLIDVTNRHRDDIYYYSKDRARLVAENEANAVFNHIEYEYEMPAWAVYKTWNTIIDGRERDSHNAENGITVPVSEPFELPGGLLMYPLDESLGAGAEEIVNCRCWVSYS